MFSYFNALKSSANGPRNPIRIPTLVANMSRDSIQRRWWYYPNYDMTSPNTTCGYDGGVAYSEFKATLHAPVEAGKTITAYYDTADFDPNYQRGLEYEVCFPSHLCGKGYSKKRHTD